MTAVVMEAASLRPLTLTISLDDDLSAKIEAFRQAHGPVPPSRTAVGRYLIALGLEHVREQAGGATQ